MISEKEELLEWRKRAAAQPAGRVVLDLEADSLHRYQEKSAWSNTRMKRVPA